MSAPTWWTTWNHPHRRLAWFQVLLTVAGNIVGGSLLSKSEGFSHIPFTIGSVVSYVVAFYFMALAMRSLPVSTSYPLLIGGVVAGVVVVGLVLFGEEVSVVKLVAIAAIVVGAILIERRPELRPEMEDGAESGHEPAPAKVQSLPSGG